MLRVRALTGPADASSTSTEFWVIREGLACPWPPRYLILVALKEMASSDSQHLPDQARRDRLLRVRDIVLTSIYLRLDPTCNHSHADHVRHGRGRELFCRD